MLICDLDGLAF